MHQRFSARYHSEPSRFSAGMPNNFLDSNLRMFICVPTFFYIAPKAPHIATCQPNKICSTPLVKSFSLDGVKSFHNRKGSSSRYLSKVHRAKVNIWQQVR